MSDIVKDAANVAISRGSAHAMLVDGYLIDPDAATRMLGPEDFKPAAPVAPAPPPKPAPAA